MLLVQKFGGTSVGDATRIKKVAEHIARTHKAGNKVCVVVSAMAGRTNGLIAMAKDMNADAAEREIDLLVSTGEQESTALVAMALQALGTPAVAMTAHQAGIYTDGVHGRARITKIDCAAMNAHLDAGEVVVVTGFQGIDEDGFTTTIGRGGSDTSAVAVAAALHADYCEIYTDVDGVFSADPNICPEAKKIDRMSYEELLEMAGAGAKVVHMRATELAAKNKVPLHVRSSQNLDTEGTIVTDKEAGIEDILVSGVTYTQNEAKVSVRAVPREAGVARALFAPLAKYNINVDMIVQTVTSGTADLSFTVQKEDLKKAMQLAEGAARTIGAGKVEAHGDVSKVSIVGIGMKSHAGVAAMMFEALSVEGIDIQLISTSEIKVSVIIDMKYTKAAVSALHKAFHL